MIRPITTLQQIENRMIMFSKNNDNVQVLLRYGSKLNNTFDLLSDLDYFIITNNVESLQKELEHIKPTMKLNYTNRTVLFFEFPSDFIDIRKIDINISDSLDDYTKFLKDTDDLNKIVLIDKNGITDDYNFIPIKTDIHEILKYNIFRFIEAFDNCSIANQSSDRYKFLFHQTIALQHLYILEYMNNGNLEFNYLPKQFTNSLLRNETSILLENFDPNSNLISGRQTRENLINKFDFVLNHVFMKYPELDLNHDLIIEFLKKIIRRDWIWNVRDIADINPLLIENNIIIRSSSFSFYTNESIFLDFCETFNIRSIIDLRHSEEIDRSPYVEKSIDYFNIPIGAKHVKPHGLKNTKIGVDPFFYEYFPRHYHHEIKEIFETILNASKPAVLHCYAGKDRTGMIVAMIQKLVGVTDEEIIIDYLSSRSDTNERKIIITLKLIEEWGGIIKYLRKIGLNSDNIEQLLKLFKK